MAEKLQVKSPYDGHLIRELDLMTWTDIDQKLDVAKKLAADRRQCLPIAQRIEILERTAELVTERADEYARQAAEEGGKPLMDSQAELKRAVNGIREAAQSIGQLTGEEIPMNMNAASSGRMAYTLREPIGVVVAISAFNHPFNLIVHQVIPAVATGCPVIVKPAANTPLSCLNVLDCLYEAGLPEEWAQLVICRRDEAEKLVTDARVSFLTFIGSAEVGWSLRSKVYPGVHCAMEHGGVAPVIVEPDADIKRMLPLLAKGGLYHAGQVCVSVQRVYVHESLVQEVSDGLVKLAEEMKVGDPLHEDTEIGPLISPSEVERVDHWVQDAVKAGAKVLTGGKRIGETCYEPTILLDPPEDADVSTQEIFGPVICVYGYKSRDEAIERANALPFSFQSAIFTKDINVAFDTVKRLEAVTVLVNDHTAFRVDWMPFGGRKQSGLGMGGIIHAMRDMTVEKMFVVNLNE